MVVSKPSTWRASSPLVIQRQKGEIAVVFPKEAASAPVVYPVPAWQDRT